MSGLWCDVHYYNIIVAGALLAYEVSTFCGCVLCFDIRYLILASLFDTAWLICTLHVCAWMSR